jgi:hypothetical protein
MREGSDRLHLPEQGCVLVRSLGIGVRLRRRCFDGFDVFGREAMIAPHRRLKSSGLRTLIRS